jgi:hypothetical protein
VVCQTADTHFEELEDYHAQSDRDIDQEDFFGEP